MRHDREEADIGSHAGAQDDHAALLAWGDVDPVGAERVARHGPSHRLFGEEEPDAGAIGFGLAARVIVNPQHDVRPARDHPADALGGKSRRHTGRPGTEAGVGQFRYSPGADLIEEARLGIGPIALPRLAGHVQMDPAVMDDPPVSGAKFDAGDRHVVVERRGQHEGTVEVGPARRDGVGLVHGEHKVGLAELPAVVEAGQRGELSRVAGRTAGFRPALQDVLLEHGKPGGVAEDPGALVRLPGGHPILGGHLMNEIGALGGVLIAQKRERRDGVGPMAPRSSATG